MSKTTYFQIEQLNSTRDVLQQRDSQITRLQEEIDNIKQYSTDSKSLIDQLQSEKSTVSRAVAQNLELKEQLTELQDKFVKMVKMANL